MAKTTMHEQLRIDTARMLRISDLKNMTPAQEVRLERAVVLRLEIDDLTAKKLAVAGLPFDVKSFVAASESLELLVGGNPETPAPTHDFSGARDELNNFFLKRAEALDHREQRESERLRDECAKLREEIAQLRAQPKAAPQPQQQPTSTNVVPIAVKERMRMEEQAAKERVARESAANERAFRDYYSGGAVVAPAWSPPDHRR